MSVEATAWVWKHTRARTPGDRLVMLAIADHAWSDGTNAYPGMKRLAQFTGMSEPGVTACIRRMIDLGELRVVEAGGGRGNRRGFEIVMAESPNHVGELTRQTTNAVGSNGAISRPETPKFSDRNPQVQRPKPPSSATETPKSVLTRNIEPVEPEPEPELNQPPSAVAPAPPGRQAQVIDAIQARGLPYSMTKADGQRIKAESSISPERIADAYAEAARRAETDRWWADNLTVAMVLSRINALELRTAATAGNGHTNGNGKRHLPRVGLGTPEQERELGEWAERRQAEGNAFMYGPPS